MALLTLLIAAVAIALIVTVALRRAWRVTLGEPSPSVDGQRQAANVTRRRVLVALSVGGIAAALCVGLNDVIAASYGLPMMLAPACFAIGATSTIALLGIPKPTADARREADLTARRPWSFGPGWAYVAPAVSAAAVVVFAVVAGITSSKAQDGTWRAFTVEFEDGSASGGPYPGWFYGIPLIVVTVLLFAATCAALARLSSAPLRGDAEDRAISLVVRRRLARFILLAGTGSLLVYFGGALSFAGLVIRNVARSGPGTDLTWLYLIGEAEFVGGFVFGIVGTALIFAAIYTAFTAAKTGITREPARAAR